LKNTKRLITVTTIALTLLLISSALIVFLNPTSIIVSAQTEYTNLQDGNAIPLPPGTTADYITDTESSLSFRPNPVGIGQPFIVNMWVSPHFSGGQRYRDYKVTITKPNGTTDVITLQPPGSDCTAWFEYIADVEGTWTVKFDFPGGYFPAGNYTYQLGTVSGRGTVINIPESAYYKPSSIGPLDLVVQKEQVLSWPESPLPTDYWTRPVSPENREWWPILGWYPATGVTGIYDPNWPADTNHYMSNYDFIPYVTAPNSAHIVWKRQGTIGGLVGGPLGYSSWGRGGGNPSIVYAGRCYETITKVVDGEPTLVWQCYDLRTGEVYWEQPVGVSMIEVVPGWFMSSALAPTMITFEAGWTGGEGSEEIMVSTGSGRGVYPTYVGGGYMVKYDAYTGTVVSNVSIAPLATGTLYANLDYPYFLSVQNLGTRMSPDYRLINWTVAGWYRDTMSYIDVKLTVMNNISWPFSGLGLVDYDAGIAVSTTNIVPLATGGIPNDIRIMAADIYTGELISNFTANVGWGVFPAQIADHGKWAARFNDGHWHCFDLYTGAHLWESELTSFPWGKFGCYGQQSYGGLLISNQYDGIVAYNWDNGKIEWFYQAKRHTHTKLSTMIITHSSLVLAALLTENSSHTLLSTQ